MIYRILSNPVLLSGVCSLITAQFIKAMVDILRIPSVSLREILLTFFWKTGGMPSSHSALALSVTTSIGFREGPDSNLFMLALAFTLVVVRDAMGVRRAAGQQAKTINIVGRELGDRFSIPFRPVKEIHGHTPAEVLVGGALGFVIAVAFSTL